MEPDIYEDDGTLAKLGLSTTQRPTMTETSLSFASIFSRKASASQSSNKCDMSFPRAGVSMRVLRSLAAWVQWEEERLAKLQQSSSGSGRNGSAVVHLPTSVVCSRIVLPLTMETQTSFVELLELQPPTSELGTIDTGKATHFLSHTWRLSFGETFSAVETFVAEEMNGQEEGIYFWVDILSVNQHHANDNMYDQNWWSSTFTTGIREIGHTVLVLSPFEDPQALKRSWCLWEIFSSVSTGARLTMQVSTKERDKFRNSFRSNDSNPVKNILSAVENIDVKNARAWQKEDQEMILDTVSTTVTTDWLNTVVKQKVTQELVDETLSLVREQIASNNIQHVLENPDILTMSKMVDLGLGIDGAELTKILRDHYEKIETGLPYTSPALQAFLILLCCTGIAATSISAEQGPTEQGDDGINLLKRVVATCTRRFGLRSAIGQDAHLRLSHQLLVIDEKEEACNVIFTALQQGLHGTPECTLGMIQALNKSSAHFIALHPFDDPEEVIAACNILETVKNTVYSIAENLRLDNSADADSTIFPILIAKLNLAVGISKKLFAIEQLNDAENHNEERVVAGLRDASQLLHEVQQACVGQLAKLEKKTIKKKFRFRKRVRTQATKHWLQMKYDSGSALLRLLKHKYQDKSQEINQEIAALEAMLIVAVNDQKHKRASMKRDKTLGNWGRGDLTKSSKSSSTYSIEVAQNYEVEYSTSYDTSGGRDSWSSSMHSEGRKSSLQVPL